MFTFKWFITSNFKEEKLDNSFRLQLILSLGCVHAYLQRHIVDGIWTQGIKKTSNGKCLPRSEIGNAFVRARKLLVRRRATAEADGSRQLIILSRGAVLLFIAMILMRENISYTWDIVLNEINTATQTYYTCK